ncbi:MazF family toxin-antitoxin system [Clostridia bacterium]|nr:MazF family toxin-antitoxin system [Clostridia bacterium]
MDDFDLFISYVEWDDGGKRRPILVYVIDGDIVSVFNITSQFETKSDAIKAHYYKINDWMQAGLEKQSYVDTGKLIDLKKSTFDSKTPIGTLTYADKIALLAFLNKR